MTAAEAVEEYLSHINGSDETLKGYRTTLEPFLRTLTPELLISRVQPRHISRYLSTPGFSQSTRNSYFNRLRTFFKYCLERHWVYDDPTELVDKPREPRTSRTVFLPDDVDRVLIAARDNADEKPERTVCIDAYELAITTGTRVGELVSRAGVT